MRFAIKLKVRHLIAALLVTAGVAVSAQTFVKPDDPGIKFTGAFFNKISASKVIFRRHSDTFLALADWNVSLANDDNAKTTSGVTINFSTDADRIDLHFRMLPGKNSWNLYSSYYIDGDSTGLLKQKRDDLTAAEDSSFIFSVSSPSTGSHTYRFVLGIYNTVAFEGITLTGGPETLNNLTLPVKPVYVAYGNSITHGQGQNTGDQAYPWVLAERMGWELCNIAVGGSRTSVPMAEMLKNEVPDKIKYMTILIGYNDAIGSSKDTTYYREKLISFIDTVRKGHPETKIFVLGQTFTIKNENKNGDPVDFDDWRKVQKYVVDSLTSDGDTLIHYINGEEFTDYSSLNNPPKDPVHLSIPGACSFGNALADTIKHLTGSPSAIFTHSAHRISIDVYPNPTTDYVTVHFSKTLEKPEYLLFDMSGKLLEHKRIKSTDAQIKMTGYPVGSYILKFKDGQLLLQTFKIIKRQ